VCLFILGRRSTEGLLATVLAPAVKLSRSPLDDLAEALVLILGRAVVLAIRGAELALLLHRGGVLDLEDGLAGVDIGLEVLAKGPALFVGVAVAAAGLEHGKVKDRDEVLGDLGGVLLADEEGLAVLGLDRVGVLCEVLEVVGVVRRLELEARGVLVILLPGVDVIRIDCIAADLGSNI
jgi:hypothetical protein